MADECMVMVYLDDGTVEEGQAMTPDAKARELVAKWAECPLPDFDPTRKEQRLIDAIAQALAAQQDEVVKLEAQVADMERINNEVRTEMKQLEQARRGGA